MAEEHAQRRLAAILAADVVSYSRLIEADEEGTRTRLRSLHAELIDPRIAADGGRIVKTTGDGILVEFPSAVAAVRNALTIQSAMAGRDTSLPEESRIRFRVGINVGDVIIEGDDIHGDGVNVAARLEGLCLPGEVYISGTVRDHVEGKLAAAFDDLGERTLKNITRPIPVFRVRPESGDPARREWSSASPLMSDKPSIAVLPFDNLSDDPQQDYFSDGMTEDLITDLSKISSLSVAARHSAFTFKGRTADVKEATDRLGVRFILEGSVRKMGNRLRINAQLIDCVHGGHLWAERYDGEMAEIFEFQDRIRGEIVAALELKLSPAEASRSNRRRTVSVEAYEHMLKGRAEYYRYGPDHMIKAIEHLTAAIAIDPDFADPYGYLSYCLFTRCHFQWPGADPDLGPALAMAEKAVTLDPDSAVAHTRLAWIQAFLNRYDESAANFETAIDLDPNNAETLASYAEILNHWDEAERAIELNARAVAIVGAAQPNWEYHFGHSYLVLRRYEDAIAKLRLAVELLPNFLPAHARIACTYIELGRVANAGRAAAHIRRINPKASAEAFISPYRSQEHRDRFGSALRKAGLPD